MTETNDSALPLAGLYAEIRPDLDRVESRLSEMIRSDNPLVDEINAYLFRPGGSGSAPPSSPSAPG